MSKIDLSKVTHCKIFPPIGIARVGDSKELDGYFFVPEHPDGDIDTPGGPIDRENIRYRDRIGNIKRQAARFHVYGFDADDNPVGEITDEHADITWTATLANKKAAWFGFFGATGARSAFRGENPPQAIDGMALAVRNPNVGSLNRVPGGPHGHHYVPDETRSSTLGNQGAGQDSERSQSQT
jgi:hypothetical protein